LLHDTNHLSTQIVNFDDSELDISLRELLHLILDLEAVGRTIRIAIATVTDIFSMTGSIKDMEGLLDGASGPIHSQRLVKPTLHILSEVTATIGWLRLDVLGNFWEIVSESHDRKPVAFAYVTVSDEARSHFEVRVAVFYVC